MRSFHILSAAIVLAGCSTVPDRTDPHPREQVSAEEVCAVAQCGYNLRITLKREDGSQFDETFDALPVVQDVGVSVYAGHTVFFEADVENGRLVNLRLVDEVVHPERTISTRLEQNEQGGMMLITRNPFKRHLRIRMGIMPLSIDRLVKTSSCPVIGEGSSYELWPYPIFQVFLGDMRLLSEDDSLVCAE